MFSHWIHGKTFGGAQDQSIGRIKGIVQRLLSFYSSVISTTSYEKHGENMSRVSPMLWANDKKITFDRAKAFN